MEGGGWIWKLEDCLENKFCIEAISNPQKAGWGCSLKVLKRFCAKTRDLRDQIWMLMTNTKTEDVWISMTRPRLIETRKLLDVETETKTENDRTALIRSRPKLKCFSLNEETETETKILSVSMTRLRFRLNYSKTRKRKKKLKKKKCWLTVKEQITRLDTFTNVCTDR